MSKTMIAVAASTLCGAARAKDGALVPFEAAGGTELTDKVLAQLGVDTAELADLIAKGAVVQVGVRTAPPKTAALEAATEAAA